MRPAVVALLLGLALALALLLRALGFEWVFVDDATLVFAPGDAQYHARRALYGFVNFPEVLFFDPYINFPGGAAISWPPGFDFTLSAFGRLWVDEPAAFLAMAAWAPPVLGALALLPAFAVARRIAGAGVGLGAAALMASLPMSVSYSRVGQLDHHCAVALIGAVLLWVLVRTIDSDRVSWLSFAVLALGRIAMLLTWHGSLLYLAAVEGVLWVAAAVTGRRDLYAVQAGSALVAVAVVAPLVWLFPEPLGGAWSAIALSRLHVTAMCAVAAVSGGLWWLEGRGSTRSASARLVWTLVLGLGVIAVLGLLPATRSGIEPALRFVTLQDGVGHRTGEQLPLFSFLGRASGRPVWEVWGLLGYALPVLPFATVWAAARERRPAAWVVAAWCAWFGTLALVQRRYGNDLGPAAAVGFALVIAAVAHRGGSIAASRTGAGVPVSAIAVVLGLLLLSPPVFGEWLPRLARSAQAMGKEPPLVDPALRTPAGSLTRFLEQVRQLTPETSGYFDARIAPEYGVVSHANFGHAVQNIARRPTPTDPFWAFIGVDNWDAAFGLLSAKSEKEALDLARQLRARYVITHASADPGGFEAWLHHHDGLQKGPRPAARHFRLVTEGPKGGAHIAQVLEVRDDESAGSRRTPGLDDLPYKLFEVVEGAVIQVRAERGETVDVELRLETPSGREVVWKGHANAASDGFARLRVPYSTSATSASSTPSQSVRALAPYRVTVGSRSVAVPVDEDDIQQGRAVVATF